VAKLRRPDIASGTLDATERERAATWRVRQARGMADEQLPPTDDLDEVERRLSMPLVEALLTQRAVRRVLPDPVDPRIVRRLIELALEAPTGSNGQSWEFVVITDAAVKEALAEQYRVAWSAYPDTRLEGDEQGERIRRSVQWQVDHFTEIPVVVVCCLRGGTEDSKTVLPPVQASSHYGSIYPSVQNLLLAARAVGLGASLVTMPLWSRSRAREILGLPSTVDPCCVVPLGWAKGRYGPKPRRPVDDVLHHDRF
jgi:nitroreductase